jgi:hypothetical protein
MAKMDNVKTETVITLELDINEVNLVLGALRELPHRIVNDVLNKVIAQAQTQVPQQNAPVPPTI